MKLYVVMVQDRHTDTEAFVFDGAEAAIEYARSTAHEYCSNEDDYDETAAHGWLFHVEYSCEGDCVWVVEKTLNEAEETKC